MRRYDGRLGVSFFFILFLLMGNAYLASRSIRGLVDAQRWVVHSWQVRTGLHDLMANFEASIAQGRGFAMVHDPRFMAGFQKAQSRIRENITQVERLTQNNQTQKKSTATLRFLLEEQMGFARGNMEKIRTGGVTFVVTPQLMEKSTKRIAAIQGLIAHMDKDEEELARRLAVEAVLNERQTRLTIFGATFVAALALVATFVLIRQTLRDRQASMETTQRLNAELEKRVEERTQSLQATNERLHAANDELEAFSYTVSHDLRAPLRHVVGFADLLDKKSGALLDDSGRRYVGLIKDAGRRAGVLIDDLLAFSRMSRTELNQSHVSMREKVEKIRTELALENPECEIIWEIQPLPMVWGDRAMLRLVWRNLMDNAVKYSSKQDSPRVQIGARQSATELEFFVKDNGVGFDMAHADKLFGVFQRLPTTEEFDGTGIGLATVRRIVARHNGRTWAESAPGQGATFYFSLPLERLRDEEKGTEIEDNSTG